MVVKNSFYNLLGLGLPLIVAVISMPMLIHALGDSRFGVLTLIWAVVSYFGLFDLGMGRALTQQLSTFIKEKRDLEIPSLVFTSLLILVGLGALAGIVLWFGAQSVGGYLSDKGDLNEIASSMRVMAIGMPFIILTSGFRGILESKLAFGIINLIRVPMGVYTFLGPLIVVLFYQNSLVAITVALTAGRVVACVVHAWFALRLLPGILAWKNYNPAKVKFLLSSGGWMTLSNILSPLMGYLDRFIIGITISAAAVAYYVTPFEVISKLWIIPNALTAVLFPKFAVGNIGDRRDSAELFRHAIMILFLVVFPIALFSATFAREILAAWIGANFSNQSAFLMQIFCVGILINCMSHVPFTLIQGVGKANVTAYIHVIQFPVFVLMLWVMTKQFGLNGTVFTWCGRMVVDGALLLWQAGKIINLGIVFPKTKNAIFLLLISISAFAICAIASVVARILGYVGATSIILFYVWNIIFSDTERAYARSWSNVGFRLLQKK